MTMLLAIIMLVASSLMGLLVIGQYELLLSLDDDASVDSSSTSSTLQLGSLLRHHRRLESCPVGSIAIDDVCTSCPIGNFQASPTVCAGCPPGFYQDVAGQVFCLECNPIHYTGSGSNSAIMPSDNTNNVLMLPLCLRLPPTPAPTTASPSTAPSASTNIPTSMSPTTMGPTTTNSIPPSKIQTKAHSTTPTNTPSMAPSTTTAITTQEPTFVSPPSLAPSVVPSNQTMAPTLMMMLDDHNGLNSSMTNLEQICTTPSTNNNTKNSIMLHGNCVDCPTYNSFAFTMVYLAVIGVLAVLFFFTPAYVWTCLDYLQTMGLLGIIRNVDFPFLVQDVLRQLHYWLAFDWLGIFPCVVIDNNIQAGRLVLVVLPFLCAIVPPDTLLFLGYALGTSIARQVADVYSAHVGLLILLLTLQSVAVTVGESVLCQGVMSDGPFCVGSSSWIDKLLSVITLCFGIAHVISLSLHVWRTRAASSAPIQRTFSESWWLWPYEFVLRKLAIVTITFLLDGMPALLLVVCIEGSSIVWYTIAAPYGNDNCPRSKGRPVVSTILMICLALLPVIHTLNEKDDDSTNRNIIPVQTYTATLLGYIVVAVAFTSIVLGQIWHLCYYRPVAKVVKDDERDEEDGGMNNKLQQDIEEELLIIEVVDVAEEIDDEDNE